VTEFPLLKEGRREGGREEGEMRNDVLEAGDFGGVRQTEAERALVVHGTDDLHGGTAVLCGYDNVPEGRQGEREGRREGGQV